MLVMKQTARETQNKKIENESKNKIIKMPQINFISDKYIQNDFKRENLSRGKFINPNSNESFSFVKKNNFLKDSLKHTNVGTKAKILLKPLKNSDKINDKHEEELSQTNSILANFSETPKSKETFTLKFYHPNINYIANPVKILGKENTHSLNHSYSPTKLKVEKISNDSQNKNFLKKRTMSSSSQKSVKEKSFHSSGLSVLNKDKVKLSFINKMDDKDFKNKSENFVSNKSNISDGGYFSNFSSRVGSNTTKNFNIKSSYHNFFQEKNNVNNVNEMINGKSQILDLEKSILPTQMKAHRSSTPNKSFFNRYVSILNSKYKKYENAKYGSKPNGCVEGYGANTFQGRIRSYNEDRVSIILNVLKPNSRKHENWPTISFFGIYDGHAGNKCSDYLKENLHQFIFRQECFPSDPIRAIQKGFEEAEKSFVLQTKPLNLINDYNRSGSCAIAVIIMDSICYVANLGDSRALLSEGASRRIFQITQDHKPNDPEEKERINKNGGYIYQSAGCKDISDAPWRIFPGKLSVSRSFGDIEAKIPELGGNPKVLIADPQIVSFKITSESDFIILGSDGIFDRFSNQEILKTIWASAIKGLSNDNIHRQSGRVVDLVMKTSLHHLTYDNITCIFICFKNFKKILFENVYNEDYYYSIINSIKKDFTYKYDESIIYDAEKAKKLIEQEDIDDQSDDHVEIYKISQTKNGTKNIGSNFFNKDNRENSITLKTLSNLPCFKTESKMNSYQGFYKPERIRIDNIDINSQTQSNSVNNITSLKSYGSNKRNLLASKNINLNLSNNSNNSTSSLSYNSFSKDLTSRSINPSSNQLNKVLTKLQK